MFHYSRSLGTFLSLVNQNSSQVQLKFRFLETFTNELKGQGHLRAEGPTTLVRTAYKKAGQWFQKHT